MLKVALTGGVATGKTYCLGRFAALGAPVIDADRLARAAVEPGTAGLAAVATRFGPDILAPDGALDRLRLAEIVFGDPVARRDLEAIIHPIVYRQISDWAKRQEDAGQTLAIADVPLLLETGRATAFDRIVVVACPPELQVLRLTERDRMSEHAARQRLDAQWPIDKKRVAADYVIDTSGSCEETDRQLEEVWHALTRDADLAARTTRA